MIILFDCRIVKIGGFAIAKRDFYRRVSCGQNACRVVPELQAGGHATINFE